ncbi:NADPH:quinone oxidoreductase family protein [Geodermatophilus sp. TF02-6]|uniref:zinc-binding dehydrogenase n=1 Tax=Geodermatophilus sp. TF02-6 TaxID=2250575 RepID=UPI000DE93420|nr:zinc-binding dehydrogenase [Geodermatophilus sp. TF02-6]RBY79563.1 NADPH:quinone oxidoreductase family protein [Geodermatophilus sp. TF02-6]
MRRIVCREFGPVERLAPVEEPDSAPGPGEVVVAVEAAAVSFVDGLIVQGRYQVRPPLPHTPGSAVAGRVRSVGADVAAVSPGDRVVVLSMAGGGFATDLVAPASAVSPLPVGLAPALAATAVENYSTMAFALSSRVRVDPGEWVLVLGAGGGIGLAAVDVARAAGARVVAAASSQTKREAARAAGAEVVVDYADLKTRVREVTGGGADVVVDPVGGPLAEAALRSLTGYGRFCVLGFAGGEIPRLPANLVLLRNRTVVGVDWGDWARTRPEAATALVRDVLGRIARGELRPPDPTCLPLDRAADALARLGRRDVVGKLALVP